MREAFVVFYHYQNIYGICLEGKSKREVSLEGNKKEKETNEATFFKWQGNYQILLHDNCQPKTQKRLNF